MDTKTKPSRVVGPEDVRRGDYVTVTHTMYEYIQDPCVSTPSQEIPIARVTVMSDDAGKAKKIVEVCLPFVLVKDANGKLDSLDLRRHRVAKLTEKYGRRAFEAKKKRKKRQPR
jgi:hypothetical protein